MRIDINGYIIPNDYKEVYDWFGMEAFCPNDIKSAKAGTKEPLEIVIGTCYGGSIFAGSEIGAEIKAHAPGATIEITGLAASAASVIAMFAKSRMSPTAMMMVHNVSSFAEGDFHAMAKESEVLKQANSAMAAAYVMKSGITLDEALKLMDKESWLTAEQAKEKGLVDEVMYSVNPGSLIASAGAGLIPKAVIEKTKAMIAESKKPGEPPMSQQTKQAYDIAYAKLKLASL